MVDPIRAQAAKWILDPDFEHPVDFSASTRIYHLLPQPDQIRFGTCVSVYNSVVEQGLVFKKTGQQTQFRKAEAEAKRLLLSEIWPYLEFRD